MSDCIQYIEFIITLLIGIFIGWRLAARRVIPKDRVCNCGHKEWAHRIKANDRACTVRTDAERKLNCACEWFVANDADGELGELRKMAGVGQ